ncbi:MAG TPA: cytochrome D1 domain-containing protein, partial [Longimicrobiales bacterium]|nr:cytochrome D1 domain-containing protein [Longimicrobiales bacterium]
AVSPDGSRVYVANGHANSISVVDPRAQREIAVVPVGRRPWGVDISRDGKFIYTANGGSNDVSVIDAATLTVIGTIPVGERPWGVALTH